MDLGIDRYCRRYKHYITIHIFNKHGTLIIYFRLLSAAGLAVPPAMSKLRVPANAKVLQLHADAMDLPLWTCRFISCAVDLTKC